MLARDPDDAPLAEPMVGRHLISKEGQAPPAPPQVHLSPQHHLDGHALKLRVLPAARPSAPLEPVMHSVMAAEGSEPGPQAGLDFTTVHYVVLVTEGYLRLYTAEGLRQGVTPCPLSALPAATLLC